jgi:hypothetical protein
VRNNVSEFLTRKGSALLGLTFPPHANVSFEKSASFNDMNKIIMKSPYRIYLRDKHAGEKIWWIQNTNTGQRESLETRDKQQALALLLVKNRPRLDAGYHAQMARAHLLVTSMCRAAPGVVITTDKAHFPSRDRTIGTRSYSMGRPLRGYCPMGPLIARLPCPWRI